MRWFGLFFLLFILSSCGVHTPSHNATDGALNSVVAIEKTLSDSCKTESIKTQLNGIKTQIQTIKSTCELEKSELKADKIKWQTAFIGLVAVILVYFLRKRI